MVLNEDNYISRIKSLTPQDWQPLLELIPLIEEASKFGEWSGIQKDESGVMRFPRITPASIVTQFTDVVYDIPIIIDFDWMSWTEGERIVQDERFDFDSLDLPTKCKLITAIVRNDRFCDGYLVSAFESGLILKILKSIKKEVSDYSSE